MNLAITQLLTKQTFRLCDKISHKYLQVPTITASCTLQRRNYCNNIGDTRRLPQLMEFPPVIWPSFVKYVKNWIFANFIIKPYFEQEFSLNDFIEASKHAVQVVSESLQNSDFNSLEGLVEKEAVTKLKDAITKLSVSQRQQLAVNKDDIFYAFPYQFICEPFQDQSSILKKIIVESSVGVMFDDADKRWVEITMCYHVLKGLKQMQETGDLPPVSLGVQPEFQDKIFVLNYRFIREFTKGVEDSWWVNIVNHFQPHTITQRSS